MEIRWQAAVIKESAKMNTAALGKTILGRLFIRIIAAIMESPFRYKFFGPVKILQGSGIRPGMDVLEIGCGTGFFTVAACKMLGNEGNLIAIDTLPAAVEAVQKKVRQANLRNVEVMQGDALDTRLGRGSLDQILVFGVIPAPMLPMDAFLAEMHRILKPDGRMAVWPPSWVHASILKSGLFASDGRNNGVMNYRRLEVHS
jgi:demethylmenaquinone methyltransferase/2-methoxy-6-polyprenyl-1,4-benzoquinol methylase